MTVTNHGGADNLGPIQKKEILGTEIQVPGRENFRIFLTPIENKGKGYKQSITYLVKTGDRTITITYNMSTSARSRELARHVFDKDIDKQLDTLEHAIGQGETVLKTTVEKNRGKFGYQIELPSKGKDEPFLKKMFSRKTLAHIGRFLKGPLAYLEHRREKLDNKAATQYKDQELKYQSKLKESVEEKPAQAAAVGGIVGSDEENISPSESEALEKSSAKEKHEKDKYVLETWISSFKGKEEFDAKKSLKRVLSTHSPMRIRADTHGAALVKSSHVSSKEKDPQLDQLLNKMQNFQAEDMHEMEMMLQLIDHLEKDPSHAPYLAKPKNKERLEAIKSRLIGPNFKVLLTRLQEDTVNLDQVKEKIQAIKLLREESLFKQPFKDKIPFVDSALEQKLVVLSGSISAQAEEIRKKADEVLLPLETHPKTLEEVQAKKEQIQQLENNLPPFLVGSEIAGRIAELKKQINTAENNIIAVRQNKERNQEKYDRIQSYSTFVEYQKGLWELNGEIAQIANENGKLHSQQESLKYRGLLECEDIVRILSSTDPEDNVAKLLLITKYSLWCNKLSPHPIEMALAKDLNEEQLQQLLISATLILQASHMRDKAGTKDKNPFIPLEPFKKLVSHVKNMPNEASDAVHHQLTALNQELSRYRLPLDSVVTTTPSDAEVQAMSSAFYAMLPEGDKPADKAVIKNLLAGIRHHHVQFVKDTNMLELNMLSRINSDTKKELDGASFAAQKNTALFSDISNAVANAIMTAPEDMVSKTYQFFQEATLQAVAENDYYTAFALHSGLKQIPVERFMQGRKTNKELNVKMLEVDKLFDMNQNYANFKAHAKSMSELTYVPNIIPGAIDKILEKLPVVQKETDESGAEKTFISTMPLMALEDLQTLYKKSRDIPAAHDKSADDFLQAFSNSLSDNERYARAREHRQKLEAQRGIKSAKG